MCVLFNVFDSLEKRSTFLVHRSTRLYRRSAASTTESVGSFFDGLEDTRRKNCELKRNFIVGGVRTFLDIDRGAYNQNN